MSVESSRLTRCWVASVTFVTILTRAAPRPWSQEMMPHCHYRFTQLPLQRGLTRAGHERGRVRPSREGGESLGSEFLVEPLHPFQQLFTLCLPHDWVFLKFPPSCPHQAAQRSVHGSQAAWSRCQPSSQRREGRGQAVRSGRQCLASIRAAVLGSSIWISSFMLSPPVPLSPAFRSKCPGRAKGPEPCPSSSHKLPVPASRPLCCLCRVNSVSLGGSRPVRGIQPEA